MTTWNRRLMLFVLMVGGTAVYAQQDREEVPGDHFSLQGALEVFKKSASPEEFERLLNSPEAGVNNLDLNGDGDIDYIRVIDRNEGNVHAFILQAVINERESQDVAVIELEKLANGKAVLQITGDADIYGIETIIEPTEEVRINAGASTVQTVVNVWAWPSVQYVYGPYYSRWNSPWSWHHRPYWWNPWRPTTYIAYYPRWESYYPYYSICHSHRIVYAQQIYRPYRNTSVIVYNRHHNQITNYRSLRGGSDFNRGRENERNAHFSAYQRNNRQESNSLNGNSRSSVNNRREYTHDGNRGSSTTPRDNSVLGNRSDNVDRTLSTWQRNSSRDMQRPDSERRFNQINANPSLQHRETRQLSSETRGTQRSSGVQPERRELSGSPAVIRPGNHDGNKSGGHKRGRD